MTTTDLLLSAWRFDPIAVLGVAAAVAAYATLPHDKGASRLAFLYAATLVLAVALVSPIGALADGYLFSAHMLQHLLLLLVVPPLSLLGVCSAQPPHPDPLPSGEGSWYRAGGSWLAGVSAMWLWHAPLLCNAATRSGAVHRVQEISLVVLGIAFWWPILAPREKERLPPLAGVLYLFTACTACTMLGIAITFSPVEVCSVYVHPVDRLGALPLLRGGWGLTPERDQQLGGLLMWVPACLVYGIGILGILARWYRTPDDGAPVAVEEAG